MRLLIFRVVRRKWSKKATCFEVQRARVVTAKEEWYSDFNFSVKMCCSKTVLHTTVCTFNNFGIERDNKGTGRPRKMSA